MQRKGGIGIGSHLPLLVHRIAGLHQMVHISNQMIIRRRWACFNSSASFTDTCISLSPCKINTGTFNFLMISCGLYVYHEII